MMNAILYFRATMMLTTSRTVSHEMFVCALHKFQKDSFGQWHHGMAGMAGMAPRFCTSWTIDIIETVRMTRKLTIDP